MYQYYSHDILYTWVYTIPNRNSSIIQKEVNVF